MNTAQYDKISVINGLRGFAILGVIYQHMFVGLTQPGYQSITINGFEFLPFSFFSNGWQGVNLFFVLSGFVLFLPYATGRRVLRSRTDFSAYYKRRAKRLLPLYYICVLVAMIFIKFPQSLETFYYHFFLMATVTFNFTIDMWTPKYNWVLWSLGIEIWFSVIFPLLVVLSEKYGIKRIFICIIAFSLLVRIAGMEVDIFRINIYLNVLKDSLLGRLDDFVLGMLICHLYITAPGKNSILKLNLNAAFGMGVLFMLICFMSWDYVCLGIIPVKASPFLHNIFHAGAFFIILSLLYSKNKVLAFIFSNKPIQIAGLMCYSIYVWHGISIWPILKNAYHPDPPFRIVIYFIMLFIFSAFTYRYIEFGHVKDGRRLFLMGSK